MVDLNNQEASIELPSEKRSQERILLDIPSTVMLEDASIDYWVERFRQYTRRSPSEIVLPAVGRTGPAFESVVQPPQASLGGSDPLKRWVSDAREALGPNAVIWGRILLNFGFLESEHLFIRDQFGIPGDQICITNPIARKIVATMITEVLQRGIEGIVFDIVDILPTAGSISLAEDQMLLHCFCDHCLRELGERGFRVQLEEFISPRNPMKIVLKNSKNGTDHIDPSQDIIQLRDTRRLLAYAHARKFLPPEEDWREEAETLLKYFEVRGKLVADSLRILSGPCKGAYRSAAILGSVDYDQSQQVTTEMMAQSSAVDEVWVPDAREKSTSGISMLCYLASRSSYYSNPLFGTLERANAIIAVAGIQKFLAQLQDRSKRWSNANRLTPASVYAALAASLYDGIVGLPLFEREHRRIVEYCTTTVTGQVLPTELLEQFVIAAGPATLAQSEEE